MEAYDVEKGFGNGYVIKGATIVFSKLAKTHIL